MSEFLKLNVLDLLKGCLVAALTAFLGALYEVLNAGGIPDLVQLKSWGLAALAAGVGYILKNFLTNSVGALLHTEPK